MSWARTRASLHDSWSRKDEALSTMPAGALATWHMNDECDAQGAFPLVVHGAVELGVPLAGEDMEASVARGGDGMVARFSGGYLDLSNDAEFALGDGHFTIALRMCDPGGLWQYPILGSYGSDREVSVALRALDGRQIIEHVEPHSTITWMFRDHGPRSVRGSHSLLEAVWGANERNEARMAMYAPSIDPDAKPRSFGGDIRNAVMRTCFPVALIGPTAWHDIVVTFTGPKLQLWIDGVLVDEEYPLGTTRTRTLPFLIGAEHSSGELKTGFHGLIDHVVVWKRALCYEEIGSISGGVEHSRARELAILGDESPAMQYFRARGSNRKAGDCIPYWDAQTNTFRLFYLILRRSHNSKWDCGHGGLEIWQASTSDLEAWDHHPVTIPITEQWEAWNGTGAVAFHDGKYHWFYPTPDYDSEKGGIQHAVSTDGVLFEKTGPHPFMVGGDCEIYEDGKGLFHLIKEAPSGNPQVRLTSSDLQTWTQVDEPLIETDVTMSTCPNLFEFGGWYYYICREGVWRSSAAFGPWASHEPGILDNLSVPKTAAFGSRRRIYAGFLRDDGWGGNLVLRELVQDADGWLGTRFVPEMIPACGEELPLSFVSPRGEVQLDIDSTRLAGDENGSSVDLSGIAGDYRVTLQVKAAPEARSFSVGLRAGGDSEEGTDLLFCPSDGTVGFSRFSHSGGTVNERPGIRGVKGLHEEFRLDIVCRHDIVDAEIGGCRTVAARFWDPGAERIRLAARGGEVIFRDIRIRRVTDTYTPYPIQSAD